MAVNVTLRKAKQGMEISQMHREGWAGLSCAALSCDSDENETMPFFICVCSTWVIRMSRLLADDARLFVTFLISLANTGINDTAQKQFLIKVAIGKYMVAIL